MTTSLLYEGIPALLLAADEIFEKFLITLSRYPFSDFLISDSILSKLKQHAPEIQVEKAQVIWRDRLNSIWLVSRKRIALEIDFSWLLSTSGSTGDPKAVKLSSQNLYQRTIGEIDLFEMKTPGYVINLLPLIHDLGLNQLLTSLMTGSTFEIFGKKLPVEFAKRLTEGPKAGITGMPMFWRNFLSVTDKLKLKIQPPEFITISGGSLSSELLTKLRVVFKDSKIYKTYGQTETFRSFAETDQSQITRDQCGGLIAQVDAILMNDKNEICKEGESGQLVHFGAGTMSGYWLDEKLSKEKLRFKSERGMGVLTGDYFKSLPNGKYQFLGRQDDLVKISGRRFYLREVEECLMKSDLISEVCVLRNENLDSEMFPEQLVAFVIPKSNLEFVEKRLRDYCMSHLQRHKVTNKFILCNEFQQTHSGKIDRQALIDKL